VSPMTSSLFVSILLLSLPSCRWRHKPVVPQHLTIRTTVCEISTNPRKFYNQRLTVSGCVSSDGVEHTALTDMSCPYTGISPAQSATLPEEQRFTPSINSDVCGTFTGTFRDALVFQKVIIDTNVLVIEQTANLKEVPVAR
jgi:hypothetical protein